MSGLGECGDAGLVQLAQSGNGEAFAELYRRHYPARPEVAGAHPTDGLAPVPEAGLTAQHTFTTPGHFTYHCNQHPEFPGMQGLVFVSDEAP